MDKKNSNTLCETWLLINGTVDGYARTKGTTYAALNVLYWLNHYGGCTQKYICEKTFLPKQTIHSIITSFYKDGLVVMEELPEDRRNKRIILTEKGRAYSESMLPQIDRAETQAFSRMSEEEIATLFRLFKNYTDNFTYALNHEQSDDENKQ